MTSNSLKIRSAILAAVLVTSTGFAAAVTSPLTPLSPLPPGVVAVASPLAPLPPLPPVPPPPGGVAA